MDLPDPIHANVVSLSAKGDALATEHRFDEALAHYRAALNLVPESRENWAASTWLLAAIGDTHYLAGNIQAASDSFSEAMHCPDAVGNPFLHLRLGQCALLLGDEVKAADELTRAYAMGGLEIFEKEDPRFLAFLDTRIRR